MDEKRLITTLQELIGIPSITGEEADLAEYIMGDLRSFGLKPKTDKMGNVFCTVGEGKKRLLLNSHMDTVPPEAYTIDPYCGTVTDGKVYGLGASDCKSGIAAMMELAKTIPAPDGEIVYTFAVHEESKLGDSIYDKGSLMLATKFKSDACIVMEPTFVDAVPTIANGCRGRSLFHIKVYGKPGHTSRPDLGVNAIDEAVKLVNAMRDHIMLNTEMHNGTPLHETLSMVKISAGSSASNIIPAFCEFIIDYRTLPRTQYARDKIAGVIEQVGVNAKIGEIFSSPGYVNEKNFDMLSTLSKEVEKSYDSKPEVKVFLGRADAEYFYRNGAQTYIFGPGTKGQAHQADEYAEVDSMVKGTQAMGNTINSFFEETG